eukprot:TRINITY_DN13098_c0_g1_i1.p1 TRINITY_DN13098_c0_g1~~TRINITY_DN13098_c0_g1_i1.p1  ORF type:complete len:253 (+),score=39.73 TRINITY_DN13098_c0_g1_i1:82-840(+)
MFVSPNSNDYSTTVNFYNHTIFVPCLSVGNVGQLALDVLISTSSAERVGYFYSSQVLPVVGNDAYDVSPSGVLSVNLEVFQLKENQVTLLQQRAPAKEGRREAFAEELVSWFKSGNFRQVVLLLSTDASRRMDSQLTGAQFRFLKTDKSLLGLPNNSSWLPLEPEFESIIFKKGTVTHSVIDKCKKLDIPLVVLIKFVSEGNNIPDGIEMASLVNEMIPIVNADAEGKVGWKLPFSWQSMIEGPPLDRTLFM